MEYIFAIIAFVVVVGIIAFRGRSVRGNDDTSKISSDTNATKPRMTSRRKLKEILDSEFYDTLNDWEKHFCNDVNNKRTKLTWNQSEKIDEIWSSIKMHGQFAKECETAFELLKEIMESPAFETLSNKEKRYMQKIYAEGKVLGSYRVQRIHEVHDRIIKRGK
jgi:hypothetical protein